jgi:hypothetical protein
MRNLTQTELSRRFSTLQFSESQGKYLQELEKHWTRTKITGNPHQRLRHQPLRTCGKKKEDDLRAREEAIKKPEKVLLLKEEEVQKREQDLKLKQEIIEKQEELLKWVMWC